ncbi:hypothetical protein [Bacillus taeanensis]|uniref:Uncharacterized protein n=1 Tax=Bacillus taeanensis TaxID=273032 RepID=A0A366XQN5_9BACI|nr:hypothetical protein [Bacillus taeanensis]RBW68026.1 hypothetical protein DS031_18995 [Bacillus taeanensis]
MKVQNVQMFALGRNLVTTFTVYHEQSPAFAEVECMFSSDRIEDCKISLRNHHEVDSSLKEELIHLAEQEAEKIFTQHSLHIKQQLKV